LELFFYSEKNGIFKKYSSPPAMKYILLPALFALAFSSCKKSYTCDCSTVYTYKSHNTGDFVTLTIPGDKNAYGQKMTKNQAVEACKHEQESTQSDFTNGITGSGQTPLEPGESIQTNCSIILK
jgi:hypothetical protein